MVEERARSPAANSYLLSLAALGNELKCRGLFEPDPVRTLAQLSVHLVLLGVGAALVIASTHPGLHGVGACAAVLGLIGVGSNSHNSSHYSTTQVKKVDMAISYFGWSTVIGFAASYWWLKHNLRHHAHPNVLGEDDDFAFMPAFAVTDQELAATHGFAGFYYRYVQPVLILVLIPLCFFKLQFAALWVVLSGIRRGGPLRPRFVVDLCCLASHVVLYLALPCLWLPWSQALLIYVLRNVALSLAVFFIFGASHLPREAACAVNSQRNAAFALRQTAATVNLSVHPLFAFFLSGIDYQIEHHLFPGIPYTRLSEASPLVREYCAVHRYPYCRIGLGRAALSSLSIFFRPKRLLDDLELARPAPLLAGGGE